MPFRKFYRKETKYQELTNNDIPHTSTRKEESERSYSLLISITVAL